MAEEIAFARKASGLVRGLSMWDAFGVGFMNQGLTPSIWVMISLGLSVYLGGNLIIATVLSLVLAGIGFPLVWGILGGSMPRSGGEYIYNSRILHPLVGIGETFGNAFIWLMWIYVLAPLVADPGADHASVHGLDWQPPTASEHLQLGLLRHRHHRQHHRLPLRRVRHQGVRPGAEGRHGPRHHRRRHHRHRAHVHLAGLHQPWNTAAAAETARSTTTTSSRSATRAGHGTMPTTWNWYDTFGVMVGRRGCSPTPTASRSSPAR